MANDLTEACKAGYAVGERGSNPHLFSSDNWMAFRAGQLVYGISGISKCTKSRGYSVRIVSLAQSRIVVTFKGNKLHQHLIERS